LIADLVGPRVQLIDTGEAVARQVVRKVPGALIGRVDATPDERFWTTGDAHSASRIMSHLWGHAVVVEAL
jgi:glutamate racemase